MEDKLLPCPFCGHRENEVTGTPGMYEILCDGCDHASFAYFYTKAMAVEAWNKRVDAALAALQRPQGQQVWQPLPEHIQVRLWQGKDHRQSNCYIVTRSIVAGRKLPPNMAVCKLVDAPVAEDTPDIAKLLVMVGAIRERWSDENVTNAAYCADGDYEGLFNRATNDISDLLDVIDALKPKGKAQ